MTASRSTIPPVASRALGLVGMLGGLGLLAAFVIDIPGAINTFRILLFCGGAISTGVAVARHGDGRTPSGCPRATAASRVGVPLLLVTLLAGCDAGASAEAPTPVPAPTAPGPHAGWTWVASDDGGLRLALPPWLQAFDTRGAIFANEAPPGEGLQLLAEGPRQVERQPAFGEDLRAWITARLADVGSGQPVFSEVPLPAGPALQFERLDRPGTTSAWRHRAWAIRTQAGVAFLWVDGPPGAWEGHLDDIARIPQLMQVTP